MPILITLLVIFRLVILPGIRVVNQYERGIVLRLSMFHRTMNPGLRIIIPFTNRGTCGKLRFEDEIKW